MKRFFSWLKDFSTNDTSDKCVTRSKPYWTTCKLVAAESIEAFYPERGPDSAGRYYAEDETPRDDQPTH